MDEKTVVDIFEEIKADMCDKYCKYASGYELTDEEYEKLLETHCDKCPLNRL